MAADLQVAEGIEVREDRTPDGRRGVDRDRFAARVVRDAKRPRGPGRGTRNRGWTRSPRDSWRPRHRGSGPSRSTARFRTTQQPSGEQLRNLSRGWTSRVRPESRVVIEPSEVKIAVRGVRWTTPGTVPRASLDRSSSPARIRPSGWVAGGSGRWREHDSGSAEGPGAGDHRGGSQTPAQAPTPEENQAHRHQQAP